MICFLKYLNLNYNSSTSISLINHIITKLNNISNLLFKNQFFGHSEKVRKYQDHITPYSSYLVHIHHILSYLVQMNCLCICLRNFINYHFHHFKIL